MKNILVTGARGGMGLAICKALSSNGYSVFGLDKTISENIPRENNIKFYSCDVTNIDEINKTADTIRAEAGELYAIVHTAGIYDMNSLIEIEESRLLRIFDINLFGVYRINKVFLPLLKKGSRIIITSSELAPLDPLPFTGLYGITKSALEKYAFSLRMELNLLGISVTVLRPGATKTQLLSDSTSAIDRFCKNTKLYPTNANKFNKIVSSVESKYVSSEKIGKLTFKILKAKRPKLIYNINRNPLLRLLNILPDRIQLFIISKILKTKN